MKPSQPVKTKVITVYFINKLGFRKSKKDYSFLYKGIKDIKIGDIIKDSRYPNRMVVSNISDNYIDYKNILDMKYLNISYHYPMNTLINTTNNKKDMNRIINISFEEAKAMYNSKNDKLKSLALRAYSEEELKELKFADIVNEVITDDNTIEILAFKEDKLKEKVRRELKILAKHYNEKHKSDKAPRYKITICKPVPDEYSVKVEYYHYYQIDTAFNNEKDAKEALKMIGEDKIIETFKDLV